MNKILIANWKMQLGMRESRRLAERLRDLGGQEKFSGTVVLCPTAPALTTVAEVLAGSDFVLGAQDAFWESHGAYTGAVSPQVLHEIGVHYVILGHSERRHHEGETDVMVHKKVRAVLATGMTPIICVGETLAERREGRRDLVISHQVQSALAGVVLGRASSVVVVYEPIWAIGTATSVEPADAQHAHLVIRQVLHDLGYIPEVVAQQYRIVYGGSIDENNVSLFLKTDAVDGVLVGGASLHAEEFVRMIHLL